MLKKNSSPAIHTLYWVLLSRGNHNDPHPCIFLLTIISIPLENRLTLFILDSSDIIVNSCHGQGFISPISWLLSLHLPNLTGKSLLLAPLLQRFANISCIRINRSACSNSSWHLNPVPVSHSMGLGWGSRIFISHKIPREADVAVSATTLYESLLYLKCSAVLSYKQLFLVSLSFARSLESLI